MNDGAPRVALLNDIPPNTLIRNPEGGEPGIWFRQNRGVVSPNGWLPEVFGNPEMEIVEHVRYEPSRDMELWRRSNPIRVAIFAELRNGSSGDSHPRTPERLVESAVEEYVRHRRYARRRSITAKTLAELLAMEGEGLVKERYDAMGLSIHAEHERRVHLTALGMAEAIRKGTGFKEQALGRASRFGLRSRAANPGNATRSI